MKKSKVVIIPARPDPTRHTRTPQPDPRYVEGQRLLMDAIRHLLQTDRAVNRDAAEFILEHVRTSFRMSDVAGDANDDKNFSTDDAASDGTHKDGKK
jgi:hypothetical protein